MLYQLSGVFMWQVYSKEVKMCLLTNPDMISAAGSWSEVSKSNLEKKLPTHPVLKKKQVTLDASNRLLVKAWLTKKSRSIVTSKALP